MKEDRDSFIEDLDDKYIPERSQFDKFIKAKKY